MFIDNRFTSRARRWLLATGVLGWAATVTAGAWNLAKYASTPGTSAVAAVTWPAEASLARAADRATLVMSVHPQCPCSRASINELDVLMARCHGRVSATVLFVDYPGLITDLTKTQLWESASRIPDVTCLRDLHGKQSERFHAETSGQVFLYDATGNLRFSGGITDARGHAGDNAGLLAIEAILNNAAPATRATPVYGCSLK